MRERKKKNPVKTKANWNNLPRIRCTIARIIEQQIFHKVNKINSSSDLKFLREEKYFNTSLCLLGTNKSFDYHNKILMYTRRV